VYDEKDENRSAEKGESERDVGYGKPPRRTRFRKGESGNPAGRPRGSKNAIAHLGKALREPVTVSENGRRKSITKCEALIKQLVTSALRGDHRSLRLLLIDQLPKLQEYEDRRVAIAEQGNFTMPTSSLDMFTSTLEFVLDSGAVPPTLLSRILNAAVQARISSADLKRAYNIEIPPALPPATPSPSSEPTALNTAAPEEDPPF
jgi:hypothetical protein